MVLTTSRHMAPNQDHLSCIISDDCENELDRFPLGLPIRFPPPIILWSARGVTVHSADHRSAFGI